jgi:AraC-like DNA-binding protein
MTSAYFGLILRGAGGMPGGPEALLEGTGLSPEGLGEWAPEITLGQQLRQVRNATGLFGPGWALAAGARFDAVTHGPMGVGVATAPTVRKSVEVMTRFSKVRAPHFRLRAEVDGDEVRLVPEDRVELGPDERSALLDIVLLSTQALVESVLGGPMREGRFEVPYAAAESVSGYAGYFHAPVRFGEREAAVVLPAAWLALDNPLADPVLFEAAFRSLEAGERRLDGADYVVARVEQILAARGGRIRLQEVARLLRLSRRTLIRRLRREGTSYRSLLDAAQRGHADALLRDPRLTVAEVAYALGYEDAANFGRACRRWFGLAPGQRREQLRDDAS